MAPPRNGSLEYFVTAASGQDRLGFRDILDSRIQQGGTPGYVVHSVRGQLDLTERSKMDLGLENVFDALYRVHGSGIDSAGRHLRLRLDLRF